MHRIAVLALEGVVPFDLGIACEAFSRVVLPDGLPGYEVTVCAERAQVGAGLFDLRAPGRLADLASADTVVVPGINCIDGPFSPQAIAALRAAWDRGARVVSICSGAFVLGAAGLLDGYRVTTHWVAASKLAERFPKAIVHPDVLFVDEGRLVTSAGASAGLDMCLHLIGRDYGQAVAAEAACLAVAPLHRDGGQAQFIRQSSPVSRFSLAALTDWLLENLQQPIDVPTMASRAAMSERTFARQFRSQLGVTPLQWVQSARIRRAQEMLERTQLSIEEIATRSGFASPVTFRTRFHHVVGLSPGAYRRNFRSAGAA